jgi:hypothetical protein
MNFYVVANGYVGAGYLRVYVSAENENRAKELASEVFKKEQQKKERLYPVEYYDVSMLSIEHFLDGSVEGATEMED